MAQINKPSDYFNTVLYNGDGTNSNAVTGVGFQPDWVWCKNRDATKSHMLADAVRGPGLALFSNATNADNSANNIMSFDSDGFTLGNDNTANTSSNAHVSWNWLAAGSTPSKTYTVKVVSDSGNKYRFDDFGTSAVTLELSEGGTYTFDQSDSSNSGHPLRFSTTSDGTHNSGTEYTTGVTTTGTPGSSGAKTVITVASSAPTLYYYCSAHSGMGGTANTPTTNSFSNFGGSIQSNISPNTTSLFSIVSFTGTGANATVGHGLGVAPSMIIFKNRSDTEGWKVYHTSIGATKNFNFNETGSAQTQSGAFNDTEPTSSVFSVGTFNSTNGSGDNMIAYCFAEKKGFSKFGKYTGNGNADGTFVYTGFKPAWLVIKKDGAGDNWLMYDNKINPENVMDTNLKANTTDSDQTNSNHNLDFLSNGFKWRTTSSTRNGSGSTIIYMAFAEEPLVGTNNVSATAR